MFLKNIKIEKTLASVVFVQGQCFVGRMFCSGAGGTKQAAIFAI